MVGWFMTPRISFAGLLIFALLASFGISAHLPGWAMALLGVFAIQFNDWLGRAISDDT